MKTIHTFSLSLLSDKELMELTSNCYEERQRREKGCKERRSRWIRDYVAAFHRHPNATYRIVGEAVIVSIYDRSIGIRMGVTTPTGNDTFELSTGIAIAFAKAMGERIPDFI